MAEIQIKPDRISWGSLERALKTESRGIGLAADLERTWRAAATVAAADAKRSARMIAAPRSRHAVSLRSAIAAGVGVDTNLGAGIVKRSIGGTKKSKQGFASVAIVWHRSAMKRAVRGKFARPESILWRAGWLLNKGRRWSHPVFGLGPNVVTGSPQAKGWFDDPIEPHLPGFALAVRQAYDDLVDRIERRSISRP